MRKRFVRSNRGVGEASGLSVSSLYSYSKSPLLERDDDTQAFYMHSSRCNGGCDYGCNGTHGELIASDIADLETGDTHSGPVRRARVER